MTMSFANATLVAAESESADRMPALSKDSDVLTSFSLL